MYHPSLWEKLLGQMNAKLMTEFFSNSVLVQVMYLTFQYLKIILVKLHNPSCKSWYSLQRWIRRKWILEGFLVIHGLFGQVNEHLRRSHGRWFFNVKRQSPEPKLSLIFSGTFLKGSFSVIAPSECLMFLHAPWPYFYLLLFCTNR